MSHHTSFFAKREPALKLAGAAYVGFLILSHSTLDPAHVWIIAATFSILMNGVYITEAWAQGRFIRTELAVCFVLIVASVLGVLSSPLFVIAAVFGHGLWDLAKHLGAGVAFFRWYTWGCFIVDVIYGSILLAYFLSQ